MSVCLSLTLAKVPNVWSTIYIFILEHIRFMINNSIRKKSTRHKNFHRLNYGRDLHRKDLT